MALQYELNPDESSYSVIGGSCTAGAVIIPSTYNGLPVTIIDEEAFIDCDSLVTISIPNTVTTILTSAFENCSNLTSVTIPNSITYISSFAFESCTALTSITIPDSVTNLGNNAFQNCTNLTNLIIGNGLTSVPPNACAGCSSLISVTIPKNAVNIEYFAFLGCINLMTVVIPSSVKNIEQYAFSGCTSLTRVNFLGNAPTLGVNVFSGTNPNLKIYRKKNFVTGWTSALDGIPVVLISDNVVKSGGTGKLTTKNRYLYIATGIGLSPNINGLRFYDSGEVTPSNFQPIYYDETQTYRLRYNGDGWRIFLIIVNESFGMFNKVDASEPPNPIGEYNGAVGWVGTATISEYFK